MPISDTLVIDGSQGEGGGQILRTSVGLAAALSGAGGPGELRIVNIRARRPKPGLRAQHLAAVKAAATVCNGQLDGAAIGSSTLVFRPGGPQAGKYFFKIGTAGSTTLVMQTVLPALLCADGESDVTVTGGTHNPMAPCFEYLRDVFCTLAEAANASVAADIGRAGFFPAGGGRIRCRIRGLGGAPHVAPVKLLDRGELRRVEGLSAVSESLPDHVARRQGARAADRMKTGRLPGRIDLARWPAASPGTLVFLRAVFSRGLAGFFALGRKGKPAEAVADEAFDSLAAFLAADGAVDPHAADQLITVLALSPGESRLTTTKVTQHLLTNAEVIRRLTGRSVTIEGDEGKPGRVTLHAM